MKIVLLGSLRLTIKQRNRVQNIVRAYLTKQNSILFQHEISSW